MMRTSPYVRGQRSPNSASAARQASASFDHLAGAKDRGSATDRAGSGTISNHLLVEMVPINGLRLPERELKVHPERQLVKLAASIEEFGFIVPVLISPSRDVIVGAARVAAARRLGRSCVPAIEIGHLSPAQIRAFRIADNRLGELGSWNEQVLAIELKEMSALDLDFNLEITGFESAEIDLRIDGIDDGQNADPDDELSRPPTDNIVSRVGDLWRLGDHLLLCGDALRPDSYARLMTGQKARVVLIDPPYNVPIAGHVSGLGRVQHREFVMASGEMDEGEFTAFLETSLRNLAHHLVDGGLIYACMDFRHHYELGTAYRAAGLDLRNICVWAKSNAGMGSMYRSQHELVFVLKAGTAPHINNVQLGKFGRYRTNVWEYAGVNSWGRGRQEELAMHPTVKPVALMADAIRDSSRRGELVLDSFAGSGTTIMAAERTGRIARAIELDPAYVDACVLRWEKFTGRRATHAELDIPFSQVAELRGQGVSIERISAGSTVGVSSTGPTPAKSPNTVSATATPASSNRGLAPVRARPRPLVAAPGRSAC